MLQLTQPGAAARTGRGAAARPAYGAAQRRGGGFGASGPRGATRPRLALRATERDPPPMEGGGCMPPDSNDFAIFWPKCFREAATSVNSLQQGHVVVVNVSGIPELEDQQRAVDFVAGACYALEGQQDVLADSIFIFSPRVAPEYAHGAARDALISLARSELKSS